MAVRLKSVIVVTVLAILSGTPLLLAQDVAAQTELQAVAADSSQPGASIPAAGQQSPGSVTGTVVDQSGAVVSGAQVKLTGADQKPSQRVLSTVSNTDGEFFFPKVDPGAFKLDVTSPGFDPKTVSGTLHAGEVENLPLIAMNVAETRMEVQVGVTQVEVAQEQIKLEEKQRVLGVIPNFYVSYIPNAAPLDARQKFQLAFRSIVDPFTFLV
ncbi:MAG: carboxypeptidase-like regulatory domain-containing protein, partial [Terriglobales bacterium]